MSETEVRELPEAPVLKVGRKTDPFTLSTAIMGCLKDYGYCTLESVMERATFQSIKACILAKQRLEKLNIHVGWSQSFLEPRPVIDGKPSTGIVTDVYLDDDEDDTDEPIE